LLLLPATISFSQINNGGFEVWDTTYHGIYSSQLYSLYGVPNPLNGKINHWDNGHSSSGVTQTTESYSGNYALILHNWYKEGKQEIWYSDSISYRPQYLQGYFKYITGGRDGVSHGRALITLTRSNGNTNDTVGMGSFKFDSTDTYQPFQIILNYTSSFIPDSIHIHFSNAYKSCFSNGVCHLLFLDNLTLSNTALGVEDLGIDGVSINVYPNPTTSELTIQTNSPKPLQFTLFNCLGEQVLCKQLPNKASMVSIDAYPSDIYFYKLSLNKQVLKSGKVVKQ